MDVEEELADDRHEAEWIYASAPLSHLAAEARAQIMSNVSARGWVVLGGDENEIERSGPRRLDALRTANACIFDVSSTSAAIGAEIATAICAGRPVIALQHTAAPPAEFIGTLVESSHLRRIIHYEDGMECVEALCRVLDDPEWLASVSRAAADVR